LPYFLGACAENDTSFLVVNSYALNSGFATQDIDRLHDVFQPVEQHALAHGSYEQSVGAFGREDYFLHNMLRIGPDNDSSQGNEHNCADKQKQAKEPEDE
jgi:hypothetical protein